MVADSVGRPLLTVALCANTNASTQVFDAVSLKRSYCIIYSKFDELFSFFLFIGEKPYACPVCPRAFNQRVVLREHIRSHHSQPDPNYEDSLMPYYCTVCGNLFKTSQEIIQHLIEHSDANTVSNRQPVVCSIAIHIPLY